MVNDFKPIKYPLLNDNVISERFIVHINFELYTSFFSKYHFVVIWQIVSSIPTKLITKSAKKNKTKKNSRKAIDLIFAFD